MMGGYTRVLPDEDRYLWTKSQFEDSWPSRWAATCAEELIFDEITHRRRRTTSSASTDMARTMVTEYGMSKKLGPLAFGHKEELVFLGREISEQRNYSRRDRLRDRQGDPRPHRRRVRAGQGGVGG